MLIYGWYFCHLSGKMKQKKKMPPKLPPQIARAYIKWQKTACRISKIHTRKLVAKNSPKNIGIFLHKQDYCRWECLYGIRAMWSLYYTSAKCFCSLRQMNKCDYIRVYVENLVNANLININCGSFSSHATFVRPRREKKEEEKKTPPAPHALLWYMSEGR